MTDEPLDSFVPFLLYRVMAKGIRQATADFAKFGLNIQEARILIVLRHHREGISAGDLAGVTCIEASALSHILRRLSRRNIVRRQRAVHDSRSVTVALTPPGKRLANVVFRVAQGHQAVLIKGLAKRERRILHVLLNRMVANTDAWVAANGGLTLTVPERKETKGGMESLSARARRSRRPARQSAARRRQVDLERDRV